jgi:hypothetical protein
MDPEKQVHILCYAAHERPFVLRKRTRFKATTGISYQIKEFVPNDSLSNTLNREAEDQQKFVIRNRIIWSYSIYAGPASVLQQCNSTSQTTAEAKRIWNSKAKTMMIF